MVITTPSSVPFTGALRSIIPDEGDHLIAHIRDGAGNEATIKMGLDEADLFRDAIARHQHPDKPAKELKNEAFGAAKAIFKSNPRKKGSKR